MIDKTKVKVVNLSSTLPLPAYETEGSDGLDLRACFDSGTPIKLWEKGRLNVIEMNPSMDTKIVLTPGSRVFIPTGLKIQLPLGWRFHIAPRSGLALNYGITLVNTPGKIDSDYRGEMGIILLNTGIISLEISHGDRVCQGSLEESKQLEWEEVQTLDSTMRGEGGFGHTGK